MPFPSEIKWQKKDGEARLLRGVCALTLLLGDSKGIQLITNLCHLPQTFSCKVKKSRGMGKTRFVWKMALK